MHHTQIKTIVDHYSEQKDNDQIEIGNPSVNLIEAIVDEQGKADMIDDFQTTFQQRQTDRNSKAAQKGKCAAINPSHQKVIEDGLNLLRQQHNLFEYL